MAHPRLFLPRSWHLGMFRRPLWACSPFPVNPPWPPFIKGGDRGEIMANKVRWFCTSTAWRNQLFGLVCTPPNMCRQPSHL
jgi:hypothetical protein